MPDDGELDGIEKSIGTFGRWQFAMCAILYLVKIPIAWHQLIIILIAPPIGDFTCASNTGDKCAPDCTEHTFDKSIFTNTIVMRWDLVCEKSYMANMAQSVLMAGILVSNIISGFLADRFGRRPVLFFAIILIVVAGTSAAFVPWLWVFMVLRFCSGFAVGSMTITSFILLMEVIGIKWRTIATSLQHTPFALGYISLAPIGYVERDWQYVQLWCSAPVGVLVLFLWAIPESPRWEISVGRREKAIKNLTRGALFNRLPVEDIPKNVDEYIEQRALKPKQGGNLKDVFRTRNLGLKFILVTTEWFNCAFLYFGTAQFIGHLNGDVYQNIAISAACTIPGMVAAVFLIQLLGRKPTILLANICCVFGMSMMVPFMNHQYLSAVSLMIAVFGCSMAFSTVYTYAGEVFPTITRNFSTGFSSFCARMGTVIVPHLMLLGDTEYKRLVPVVFSAISFVALLAGLWLPETKDCTLPDTVEESEKFRITIKFNKQ